MAGDTDGLSPCTAGVTESKALVSQEVGWVATEFGKRIVAAYQNKIGVSLGPRDGEALAEFVKEHPEADPELGERAVAEAAEQGRRVGMSYVLAICERYLQDGESGKQSDASRASDYQRSDDFIRAYRAKQKARGQP